MTERIQRGSVRPYYSRTNEEFALEALNSPDPTGHLKILQAKRRKSQNDLLRRLTKKGVLASDDLVNGVIITGEGRNRRVELNLSNTPILQEHGLAEVFSGFTFGSRSSIFKQAEKLAQSKAADIKEQIPTSAHTPDVSTYDTPSVGHLEGAQVNSLLGDGSGSKQAAQPDRDSNPGIREPEIEALIGFLEGLQRITRGEVVSPISDGISGLPCSQTSSGNVATSSTTQGIERERALVSKVSEPANIPPFLRPGRPKPKAGIDFTVPPMPRALAERFSHRGVTAASSESSPTAVPNLTPAKVVKEQPAPVVKFKVLSQGARKSVVLKFAEWWKKGSRAEGLYAGAVIAILALGSAVVVAASTRQINQHEDSLPAPMTVEAPKIELLEENRLRLEALSATGTARAAVTPVPPDYIDSLSPRQRQIQTVTAPETRQTVSPSLVDERSTSVAAAGAAETPTPEPLSPTIAAPETITQLVQDEVSEDSSDKPSAESLPPTGVPYKVVFPLAGSIVSFGLGGILRKRAAKASI